MSFFRLRTYAGNRWPPLSEPGLSQIWAAYQALIRPSGSTQPRLNASNWSRFVHCSNTVWPTSPITAIYARHRASQSVPFRAGAILIGFHFSLAAPGRSISSSSAQTTLPPGTVPLDEDNTSGTSGVPVRVLKTNIYYVWWLAFYLRICNGVGSTRPAQWQSFGNSQDRSRTRPLLARRTIIVLATDPRTTHRNRPVICNGPRGIPEEQLEWLSTVNPDYLLSHTSNLELLASLLLDEPHQFPNLRAVQVVSETLTGS